MGRAAWGWRAAQLVLLLGVALSQVAEEEACEANAQGHETGADVTSSSMLQRNALRAKASFDGLSAGEDGVEALSLAESDESEGAEEETEVDEEDMEFNSNFRTLTFQGIEIIIHADSRVATHGEGTWVITIPDSNCTDAFLASLEENMPPGSYSEFKGDPDHGGLCTFMMHGSLQQVQQELATHSFPVKPIVEAASNWSLIPDNETDDSLLELEAGKLHQSNPTWGIDRIDDRSGLDQDYSPDYTGAGVHVYVADTGIRVTHQEFEGRAIPTLDCTLPSTPCTPCSANDTTCANDLQGHGTHCAGTIGGKEYGVAKAALLHSVKVLSDSGSGSWSWFVSSLNWVMASGYKPSIFSASLGGRGSVSSVTMAIDSAVSVGVVVVVAAGNSNDDGCNYSPAGVGSAITVGSTTSADYRSSFSNYGSCVDIFAPGSSIRSARHTSDSGSTTKSGTSMACPHVAGVAAMILQKDGSLTAPQVASVLDSVATTGAISDVKGTANTFLYSGIYTGPPTPAPPTMPPTPAPTPAPLMPVPAVGFCGFDVAATGGTYCGLWYDEQADNFDWTRRSGSTSSSHTGPSGPAGGTHYLYIETSSPRKLGDVAVLSTPPLVISGPTFLVFQYHMYGATIEGLEVTVDGAIVWSQYSATGNQWLQAQVDLSNFSHSHPVVSFKGYRGSSYTGDVAIDSVEFTATPPPTPSPPTPVPAPTPGPPVAPAGFCGFEAGFGGGCSIWSNAGGDDFDWTIRSGGTPSSGTGPSGAFEGSKYIYIETSSPRNPGDFAVLKSQPLLLTTPVSLKFRYHMKGSDIGKLEVKVGPTTVWQRSSQATSWFQKEVDLTPWLGTVQEISIVGTRGSGWSGDIALDSLEFDIPPVPTPAPTSPPTMPPSPAPTPPPMIAAGSCSFENGFGGNCSMWQNTGGDDFDWTVKKGSTPSSHTGPSSAYDGDYYVYIETSSPRQPGDYAILRTPPLQVMGPTNFTFWYHMYGSNCNELAVSVDSYWMFHKQGNQGNSWKQASIDLTPWWGWTPRILIVAKRGSSYRGDIALDLLQFTSPSPAPAPPPSPWPTMPPAPTPGHTMPPAPTPWPTMPPAPTPWPTMPPAPTPWPTMPPAPTPWPTMPPAPTPWPSVPPSPMPGPTSKPMPTPKPPAPVPTPWPTMPPAPTPWPTMSPAPTPPTVIVPGPPGPPGAPGTAGPPGPVGPPGPPR